MRFKPALQNPDGESSRTANRRPVFSSLLCSLDQETPVHRTPEKPRYEKSAGTSTWFGPWSILRMSPRTTALLSMSLVVFGTNWMVTTSAVAHESDFPVRYVAENGTDEGNCGDLNQPCRTILYAVKQAGKGEHILVSGGTYQVADSDIAILLSDMVPVEGGYSTQTGFAAADVDQQPTYVIGPSFRHRDRLRERGLVLLQDPKGLEIGSGLTAPTALSLTTPASCTNGTAGPYSCNGIDFVARVALGGFSTNPTSANDIWGFVDLNDQREYAIIGLRNGTAVIDVTDPANPSEVGTVPGLSSTWRDVKVYQFHSAAEARWKAYAYVTADAVVQGLQIIDLTNLPNSISLAATYNQFSSAHNIYMGNVDYETGVALPGMQPFAYILGANTDGGAFRILELSNPAAPTEVTAPPMGTGYVHDATTLVVSGGRTSACAAGHDPCEIFIDYNETTVDIWDVTDKTAPFKVSSTPYPNSAYTHSGWWTENKRYVFIQDELDERDHGLNTTLRALDINDLAAPTLAGTWSGSTQAIDHNGFVHGDHYYMSNYRRGLTVLDISDPTSPQETRFFDTFPSPAENSAFFNGAWGVYPYLPSGTLLVSDIEGGLFLLRQAAGVPPVNAGVLGRSNNFSWAPPKKVSSNSNILELHFQLEEAANVHISLNSSVRTNGAPVLIRTGVYNQPQPSTMWTYSYRPLQLAQTNKWYNFSSMISVNLPAGSHALYWKIWVSGTELELSAGTILLEAFYSSATPLTEPQITTIDSEGAVTFR